MKALLLLALALSACGPLPAPIPRATGLPTILVTATNTRRPTRTPRSTETLEPSQTPTAFHPPTPKPPPPFTLTPSVAPTLPFAIATAFPTAQIVTITPSPRAADALDCKLIWQSPPNGSIYFTGRKFSVGWNIRNIGTTTWEPGSFTFTYLEGARLATHDFEIPLKEAVPPGQEIVLSVPMKAPQTPSFYTTHWGIRQGNTYFCRLTLSIEVQ